MKHYVLISKRWHRPEIEITVKSPRDLGPASKDGLGGEMSIQMELDSFLESLSVEMKNPTFVFTKNQLKERMLEASKEVIKEMKAKSSEIT